MTWGTTPILAPASSLWLWLPAACCRNHDDDGECTSASESHTGWSREATETGRPGHPRTGEGFATPTAGRPAKSRIPPAPPCALVNVHSFKQVTELSPCHARACAHTHVHTHTPCGEEPQSKVAENHFTSKINTEAKWLNELNEAGTINCLNESCKDPKAQKP